MVIIAETWVMDHAVTKIVTQTVIAAMELVADCCEAQQSILGNVNKRAQTKTEMETVTVQTVRPPIPMCSPALKKHAAMVLMAIVMGLPMKDVHPVRTLTKMVVAMTKTVRR